MQISHGVRRGLIPPSQQPEEPRITDAGGSAWLGALGARGCPHSAEGQLWSGAPLSPLGPRGLPGRGDPSFFLPPQKPPLFLLCSGSGEGGQEPLLLPQRDPGVPAEPGEGMGWDALPGVCHRGEVVLLSRPF